MRSGLKTEPSDELDVWDMDMANACDACESGGMCIWDWEWEWDCESDCESAPKARSKSPEPCVSGKPRSASLSVAKDANESEREL